VSKVSFFTEDVKLPVFPEATLQQTVKFLISNEGKQQGAISVIFCSDDFLLKMNEQYLNHQYYTDIITFDYVEGSLISGDLFISVDRVEENAGKLGFPMEIELCRVILHGILHLTGYKDETDDEKQQMRKKEDFYLLKMGFKSE
jgi:rRNA maturation RNase YbeY